MARNDRTYDEGGKRRPDRRKTGRLPDTVDLYVQALRAQGATPATQHHARKELALWVRDLEQQGHSLLLRDVTAMDVLGHLNGLRDAGRRPRTLRTRFQAVRSFLQWAVTWKLLKENPAAPIKSPKVPKQYKGFLSEQEFNELLRWCDPETFIGSRRLAMLMLAATTSLRRSELFSLEVDDLVWESAVIRLDRARGKGQKDRIVPFTVDAQLAVIRYIAFRNDTVPSMWLTQSGAPMTLHAFESDMRRLYENAGVQAKDRFHVFRRTWARASLRAKIERPYIMGVGGWEDGQMLDHYTRAMQKEDQALEAYRDFRPFWN